MIDPGIKWFLAVSLAVHAVVLTAWQQHQPLGNNDGRVLELTVINTPIGRF